MTIKISEPGALNWQVPIVDTQGRPVPAFMRHLKRLFKNTETTLTTAQTAGTTADAATTSLDDKVDKTTTVTAGAGLDGGGALSASITIDANVQDILALLGAASQGAILYKGASGWAILGPGAAGQKLTSGGAGANPSWV